MGDTERMLPAKALPEVMMFRRQNQDDIHGRLKGAESFNCMHQQRPPLQEQKLLRDGGLHPTSAAAGNNDTVFLHFAVLPERPSRGLLASDNIILSCTDNA